MAAGEVASLCGTVIQLAQLIRDTGSCWYKASADWQDFPLKLNRLERKHNFWLAEVKKVGLSSDSDLMQALSEAKSLLESEKVRLARKSKKTSICGVRYSGGCCSKLSMTVFPGGLGLAIQRAIDGYAEVSHVLKDEVEAAALLENKASRQHTSTIQKDDRYVPLRLTEDAVKEALNNRRHLSMVLLHGGPGKGKSTLVRHLARNYKEKTDAATFEHVLYLECGRNANILAKQLELLQHVSVCNPTSLVQGQSGSEKLIPKQLSRFLKDQKILLVFDDVWEAELLQRMVDLCGQEVKILVTSQLGSLCDDINCFTTCIQMENVQLEDGRKILASHTRLSTQKITADLEGVMDKIFVEAQGNPLALASIATAIDNHRSDDIEEWERASEDFLRLLHSEDTAFIYGEKYPKSFWSAMKLSIQSLPKDVQDLLILTHLCSGPSVPEEIVSILYKRVALDGNTTPFAKSRKELESRELLKITTQYLIAGDSRKERSWSVHSQHKLFIEDELGDRKKSMLESLLGLSKGTDFETQVDVDAMVQTVVCALYLDEQFATEAAKKMGVPLEKFNNLRRSAIQPITRLLGMPVSQRWPPTAQASARQMFLRYICDNKLQADGILQLLTLPISTLPMFNVLRDIVTIDVELSNRVPEVFSEIVRSRGILQQLVDLLHKNDNPGVQELALRLLGRLVYFSAEAKLEFVQIPGACDKLVNLLSSKNHPGHQAGAAFAIRNILEHADDVTKRKLSATEGLVERLLALLVDHRTEMYIEGRAAAALTLIDPAKGNGARLRSWSAYSQRGRANMLMNLNSDSLADLDTALEEQPRSFCSLSFRWTVKWRLGDSQGAFEDINKAMEMSPSKRAVCLQERGVLKHLTGDLVGALADLNEGLDLEPSDYEKLKHRGFVKYLMNDEDGARSDAELALKNKPSLVDMCGFQLRLLGTSSVAYLDYNLK